MVRNRDTAFKTEKTFNIVNPIAQSLRDGVFKMSSTSIEKYKSNLYTLIFTGIGERPMEPTFGTNIKYYMFDQIGDDVENNIRNDILEKVKYWIPEITITSIDFSDSITDTENNKISFKINFRLTVDPTIQDFLELEMGV